MSARMHHRYGRSRIGFYDDMTCEGETCRFFDRKGIHVGAEEDGATRPIAQHGDNTRAADARCHFISQCFYSLGKLCSGLLLVHGEFRVPMQIEIKRLNLWLNGIHLIGGWSCPGCRTFLRSSGSCWKHTTKNEGEDRAVDEVPPWEVDDTLRFSSL